MFSSCLEGADGGAVILNIVVAAVYDTGDSGYARNPIHEKPSPGQRIG